MANNGKEALQLLDESFDIVLMDIQMPEMDGIEACRVIKERYTRLPVIAFTANVLPADIDKYNATGFDGVLGKPLERGSLSAMLKKLVKPSPLDNSDEEDTISSAKNQRNFH